MASDPLPSSPPPRSRRPRVRVQPSWWWDVFFTVLAATGNVSKAADAAGQRRSTVYEISELSTDFAAQWKAALLAYDVALEERVSAEKRRRMALARFNLDLE